MRRLFEIIVDCHAVFVKTARNDEKGVFVAVIGWYYGVDEVGVCAVKFLCKASFITLCRQAREQISTLQGGFAEFCPPFC